MRRWAVLCGLLSLPTAAMAGDKPIVAAPVPAWVRPVVAPASVAPSEAPITILLADQQVRFEPGGGVTAFGTVHLRINTAQGLAAGNVSLPWRPDVGDLTVHRLAIRRADKVIDVLASGQTFTVVRRETNLESATLDGVLTANMQPEGLQVGDVLELTTSYTSRDPVLAGHVEHLLAFGASAPVGRVHVRVSWPAAMPIRIGVTGGLAVPRPARQGGEMSVEWSEDDVRPVQPPKMAPARYQVGRVLTLTDYQRWADVGALFAPLYVKAATLPASGPLADEVARIRAASSDPKSRAAAALALVQDRVRYVALAMGAGGLVPADAATTWARRYGDCKAKTALLLAVLHALDIAADPVAVNAGGGDGLDARLPTIAAFNHVLVRAVIGGRTYWLDGTRTGDASLDRIVVPDVGWGLPLIVRDAALVRMVPPPLTAPTTETEVAIDATAGLTVPAPVKVVQTYRGDAGVGMNAAVGALTGEDRARALKEMWKQQYDFIDVETTEVAFDRATAELRLTMTGKARMDWSSGWYETDGLGLGYRADLTREAGPDRDAPYRVDFPRYSRTVETIRLPQGFPMTMPLGQKQAIDRVVGGVEYRRRGGVEGRVFRVEATERAIAAEFPASEAPAVQAALREMANQTLYLRRPASYDLTDAELALAERQQPTTVAGLLERGFAYSNRSRLDDALRDYDAALKLAPRNEDVLANRGLVYAWKSDFVAADRDLTAAEAIDPLHVVAMRARGLVAQRRGDHAAAAALFGKVLARYPGDDFSLRRRIVSYRAMGNVAAALADLDTMSAAAPADMSLQLTRFNVLRNAGRIDEAVAGIRAAVARAAPDDSYAHVVAANALVATGHREEATREFDRALAIKPESYIYLNRAMARPTTDLAARADDIDQALRLDPKSSDALTAKADLQRRRGDVAGSLATWDAALATEPRNGYLLAERGAARLRAGRRVDGERDLATARSLATSASDFNHICWTQAIAGVTLDAALADCDAALAKEPKSASIIDSRAFVLLRLGRFPDAVAAYDQALALSPTLGASLYGRGIARARMNQRAQADADLAAARKEDADIDTTFADYGVTP